MTTAPTRSANSTLLLRQMPLIWWTTSSSCSAEGPGASSPALSGESSRSLTLMVNGASPSESRSEEALSVLEPLYSRDPQRRRGRRVKHRIGDELEWHVSPHAVR